MYAIIRTGGKQYKVTEGDVLYIEKLTAEAGEAVTAPMPGNILKVNVTADQAVKEGDVLVVLEAMKMENEILAPKACTVKQVLVSKGATVDTGATLVVLG